MVLMHITIISIIGTFLNVGFRFFVSFISFFFSGGSFSLADSFMWTAVRLFFLFIRLVLGITLRIENNCLISVIANDVLSCGSSIGGINVSAGGLNIGEGAAGVSGSTHQRIQHSRHSCVCPLGLRDCTFVTKTLFHFNIFLRSLVGFDE